MGLFFNFFSPRCDTHHFRRKSASNSSTKNGGGPGVRLRKRQRLKKPK
jgi:hypothetical protein